MYLKSIVIIFLLIKMQTLRDYQKSFRTKCITIKLSFIYSSCYFKGSSTFIPFMQLKASHRRVVEEILDIKIFSIMGFLLKQKIKEVADEIKDLDYQFELACEKNCNATKLY